MGDRLEVVVTAEDQATGPLNGLKTTLEGLGKVASGAFKFGLGLAQDGVEALGKGLLLSMTEAMDAEKIMAQTKATIKATGGAAGMTAEEIANLAGSLSEASTFSDDAIQQAENMLLNFTDIGEDVFPTATQAIVDMSAALGTDLTATAKQLGNALSDPIEGISILEKAGVNLTAEQEEVIKSLVATGDEAGAQKFMLEQLSDIYGGSGAAQAETFSGKLEKLKKHLLDAAEGIGSKLLPIASDLFDNVIAPALPLIEELGTSIGTALANLAGGNVKTTFETIAALVQGLMQGLATGDFSGLQNLLPPELVAQLGPFADALQNLASAFIERWPQMQAVGQQFVDWLLGAFAIIGPQLLANITTALNAIAEFWRVHGETVLNIVRFVTEVILATLGGALTLLSGIVTAALTLISGSLRAWSLLLQGDFTGVWALFTQTMSSIWQTILGTLAAFMNLALSIVGSNLDEFSATWANNWNMALLIITTVWSKIQTAVSTKVMEMTGGLQGVIINTINWLRDQIDTFYNIGVAWFEGITAGILLKVTYLKDAVVNSIKETIDAARNTLGISSPSRVFAEVGQQIMAGMAQGIAGSVQLPQAAFGQSVAGLQAQAAPTSVTNIFNQSNSVRTNEDVELLARQVAAYFKG